MMKWRRRDARWRRDTVMHSCRICHHDNWWYRRGLSVDGRLWRVGDNGVKERGQTTQDVNTPLLGGQTWVWVDNQWRCYCWRASSVLAGGRGELTRLSYQTYQVRQKASCNACDEGWTAFQQDVKNDEWIQPTHNTSSSLSAAAATTAGMGQYTELWDKGYHKG